MMTLSYAGVAVLVALLLSIAVLLMPNRGAEGRYSPADMPGALELSAPGVAFHNADADASTAFREEAAGFSAYYRVPAPTDADAPRLNIKTITDKLRAPPDQNDATVRVLGRAGKVVDQGVNFAIVTISMIAAVGQPGEDESVDVTLYYDDRGWIVAYLKVDVPAAAIWRYRPLNAADGDTAKRPNELLADNLLILGINAVLKANNPAANAITHETVKTVGGYHHWQYPQCDAFILFSNQTTSGKSDPVSIVIPPTIRDIQASAAALIAHTPVKGEEARASVLIDGTPKVTAETPNYLSVDHFDLNPDTERSSVYRMAVSGTGGKLLVGVVMLVYDKPEP